MPPNIVHHIRINGPVVRRDDVLSSPVLQDPAPDALYRSLGVAYPKFFKMDALCKWAWLGAEMLLTNEGKPIYEGMPAERMAVVLFTKSGCLAADKRYAETLSSIPSPALFVYTLSNIMLGEVAIRHGFKGEQLCMVQDAFDSEELLFWVNDLLAQKDMDACLCGWVDIDGDTPDLCMFWVSRDGNGRAFSRDTVDACY